MTCLTQQASLSIERMSSTPSQQARVVEQAEEANAELLELLADFLPQRFPDLFTRDGDALINHVTGDVWDLTDKSRDPLEVSALLVQVHALPCPCPVCSALRLLAVPAAALPPYSPNLA